jgi:PEP-CTERM motif
LVQEECLMKIRTAVIAATLILTGSVAAQTATVSRTVPVTFTGTVSSTAADTILVRQPDGTLARFTGPLPALAYAAGDPVTISFNATMPTRSYYDSGTYQGQIAADGIYRIRVSTQPGSSLIGNIGQASPSDVSGPIGFASNFGEPAYSAMTIVYDYNADSYSIEGSGRFFAGAFAGPGYLYDAATDSYIACNGERECAGAGLGGPADPVSFTLNGGADGSTIASSAIRISSTDATSGTGRGIFSWLFSGSWNLSQFGGATQVPEPGMLLLFGGASAFVARRRRKRLAA